MAEEDTFALGRQSAEAKALGLYRLLGHDGNTVEALRELIAVPPLIEDGATQFPTMECGLDALRQLPELAKTSSNEFRLMHLPAKAVIATVNVRSS
jgi:hypothetical protein